MQHSTFQDIRSTFALKISGTSAVPLNNTFRSSEKEVSQFHKLLTLGLKGFFFFYLPLTSNKRHFTNAHNTRYEIYIYMINVKMLERG